jgi:hypothetical protein
MSKKAGGLRRVVPLVAPVLTAVVVGLVAWASPAESTPENLSKFNSHYDTQGSRLDSCQTCHTSAGGTKSNVNQYGNDWAAANHDFAAVEGLDSDGDGFTNIDEIKALTFPGDAKDNPDTKAKPKPAPSTTTTTKPAGPLPILPKLPIG